MAKKQRPVGILDFETDPFINGRYPQPFAGCVYFGPDDYSVRWSDDDCASQIVDVIEGYGECILYAHNGGKFDFHFLMPYAALGDIKIIGGRIAEMRIGEAILRDSLLLIPFGLGKYQKTVIDYSKFEEGVREEHRTEIIDYLISDCDNTLTLLKGFHERLGQKLTIGSAAMAQIKKSGIKVEKQNQTHDKTFREFYYGGRVEAIKPGVHEGEFKCIDINSAYPFAMMEQHPCGHKREYLFSRELPDVLNNQFLKIKATSHGALPYREKNGNLSFPRDGILRHFNCTGWELSAAIDTHFNFDIMEILECWAPARTMTFRPFVIDHYKKRQEYKQSGDLIGELVEKYVLNSAYGKFATNPENFYTWILGEAGVAMDGDNPPYAEFPGIWLWRFDPDERDVAKGYFDVATAASITGYVRAMMWRSLCEVESPMYCDTDSIICKDTGSLKLDGKELGSWKTEMEGNRLAIAGKKLYAFSDSRGKHKTACKGAHLDAEEIFRVAAGESIKWMNQAPTFSLARGAHFIVREIVSTNTRNEREKRKKILKGSEH